MHSLSQAIPFICLSYCYYLSRYLGQETAKWPLLASSQADTLLLPV